MRAPTHLEIFMLTIAILCISFSSGMMFKNGMNFVNECNNPARIE